MLLIILLGGATLALIMARMARLKFYLKRIALEKSFNIGSMLIIKQIKI